MTLESKADFVSSFPKVFCNLSIYVYLWNSCFILMVLSILCGMSVAVDHIDIFILESRTCSTLRMWPLGQGCACWIKEDNDRISLSEITHNFNFINIQVCLWTEKSLLRDMLIVFHKVCNWLKKTLKYQVIICFFLCFQLCIVNIFLFSCVHINSNQTNTTKIIIQKLPMQKIWSVLFPLSVFSISDLWFLSLEPCVLHYYSVKCWAYVGNLL